MEARLENRLSQTEKALVAERVARQTDEVAQQTVETWPAGVDAEAFGRLPMFRGDIDLSGRTDSMSLWSVTVWSYFGKFNQTATRLLQQVETTSVEDPIIADDAAMTRPERRLSTNVLCACSDLQEEGAAAGPTSSLWETAVQRIRATSSGEIRRNAPIPLVADKIRRAGADGPSAGELAEGLLVFVESHCLECSSRPTSRRNSWALLTRASTLLSSSPFERPSLGMSPIWNCQDLCVKVANVGSQRCCFLNRFAQLRDPRSLERCTTILFGTTLVMAVLRS